MSAKERLQALQAALEERGVKDVKFYFNPSSETSVSDLASDMAAVLEAVRDGKTRKIPSFSSLNAA
ncbi:MAG: hypothetical protein NTW01_10060 [Gammaproteobacteria bacterium]|nr:hypothetical protein [Gammaproteobacteria bacterium]